MAGTDIFISYKSERRKAAEHLAAVLTLYGYSVWFDYELIKGHDFGLQIGRKIREARALVVLWCSLSVHSRWVIEEVHLADKLGILIPLIIEPCDLPVGFQRQDYIDLSSWDCAPRSHQLDPLIDALEGRIGRPPQIDYKGMREYEATWRRFAAPSLKAFALGKPLADVEGDRKIPQTGTVAGVRGSPPAALPVAPAPVDHRHELMALAAREWPAVRDSAAPQCLERFERHFPGTYYAEEARVLREKIEAEARQRAAEEERQTKERQAEARELREKIETETRQRAAKEERRAQERQAQEQKFRAEGRIPVLVGDRNASQTRRLLPGSGEPSCDIDGGPEMVVVPAGKFLMGSPADFLGFGGEPGRFRDEGPRHEVTFAHPFAVGRHAVTRGQFAAFVNATGHKTSDRWRDSGFRQDDSHPVVCIRWDDANAYAAWMAEITGRPYRLLTEAEWEYVARAGTTTPFWWGSSITSDQANYDGNHVYEGGGRKGEYRGGTVPVGSFDPNPWGLHNVHGNVWEWCEDTWYDTYDGAPRDGSAWISKGSQSGRVVRGGSWSSYPRYLRSARRNWFTVESDFLGCRLARTLTS